MKSRRAKILREQSRISKRRHKIMIGSRHRALLEGVSDESELFLQARLESQAPEIDGHVLINDIPDGFDVKIGDFAEIEITDAHEYDLVARIV